MSAINPASDRKSSLEGKTLEARCILFDLDGTLYDSAEYSARLEVEIARFVSQQLNLDLDKTKVLLDQRRKELGTLTRAIQSLGIDRNIFFETLADRIEPSLYIPIDLTVRSVIGTFREHGFRTGLVSNSGRPLVRKILAAIGVEESLFDIMVTSTEAEPKPSPESFMLAVKKIGCDVVDVLYVGDREEAEIVPASRLGLKTVLLDRTGAARETCADAVVGSLSGVLTVVKLAGN